MSNLYDRVEMLARRKGLTINGLAKEAGISPSIMYEIRSGRKTGFSRTTAERIATVLCVGVDELYATKTETEKEKAPVEMTEAEMYAQIIRLYGSLNAEQKAAADKYLQYLLDMQENK